MTERGDGDGREPPSDATTPAEVDSPQGLVGWVRWFWTAEEGLIIYVRDVVTSVGAVLVVGLVLFAISGIWPPMVAIESGSMEPNMERGDLVFVVDNERFTPEQAVVHEGETTGVIPAQRAEQADHSTFGRNGDVIVYKPNGNRFTTPIIHRAMLWVEAGENWYDRADPAATRNADDCGELSNCPAPHAGFITLGDANPNYDQVTGLSQPVQPDWVIGTAELRVPYLGHVRLALSQVGTTDLATGGAAASTGLSPSPEETGVRTRTDREPNATATTPPERRGAARAEPAPSAAAPPAVA
jgi:signal peptidase